MLLPAVFVKLLWKWWKSINVKIAISKLSVYKSVYLCDKNSYWWRWGYISIEISYHVSLFTKEEVERVEVTGDKSRHKRKYPTIQWRVRYRETAKLLIRRKSLNCPSDNDRDWIRHQWQWPGLVKIVNEKEF